MSPRRDTTVAGPGRSLKQYSLAGATAGGASALVLIALLLLGVGSSPAHHRPTPVKAPARAQASRPHVLPAPTKVAVHKAPVHKPPIHKAPPTNSATAGLPASGATGVRRDVAATELPDPEAARSFPAPASTRHSAAATPTVAAEAAVAPGAPSDAEVRRELHQMQAVERAARKQTFAAVPGGQSIGGNGTIAAPPGVPAVIARVIAGANAITDFPYVFGGGHASFVDNAYDCSGSVSYALAAGGLLSAPETSGQLESWGAPGPGRWITVYANAGHTYMYVDGMLYDTAGRSGVYASRWLVGATDNSGFVARHWPGL